MRQAPVALEPFHPCAELQSACLGQHGQPVRMLHARCRRRQGKKKGQHPAGIEGAGDQPTLVLYHQQKVRSVGRVIRSPDGALQILGGLQLGNAGEFADFDRHHSTSRVAVTVSTKRWSSVTPMPGPVFGTAMRPSTTSSGSLMMSRWK